MQGEIAVATDGEIAILDGKAQGYRPRWVKLVGAILLGCGGWQAQAQPAKPLAAIVGVVTDPSGAVVPGAQITLRSIDGPATAVSGTESGPTGAYRILVHAGTYVVTVNAAGFARFESAPVRVSAGAEELDEAGLQQHTVDVRLKIEVKVERIEVPDDAAQSDNRSGSALVLGAREVAEMPLDPTALLDELRGLAGNMAAALSVDGFSGTKLPARDSIREIRINQNPYSAENDTEPLNGVIQVSSKPGTNQLHGEAYVYGDDSALDAGNPFAPAQPPFYASGLGGDVSGPLNPRSSYYGSVDQMRQGINTAVDAQTLDANLNQAVTNYAVASPRTSLNVAPRLDVRAGANSTMTLRYIYDRATQDNGGVGQLALASQGFQSDTVAQTLRATNTQAMGAKMVNETRLQYIRTRTTQTPVSTAPTLLVEGAETDGGNNQGMYSDHQNQVELQSYLSAAEGRHYLEMGGRLRVGRDANRSEANFNGEFIFSTLSAYQATRQGMAAGDSIAQITAAGGGASQFNLTVGSPNAAVTIADAGLFVQDDWRVRPNLTLSYGLRFETQNYIPDHADWAPRVGFSWGPGGQNGAKAAAPKWVVRGGAGVFYRRFTMQPALQVARQNGVTQLEYVVQSPQFCPVIPGAASAGCSGPMVAELGAQSAPVTYGVAADFHAPYFIGANVSLERRLSKHGVVSVSYLSNLGVHTQLTENVNAPLPGTYNPANPGSGVRPNGSSQNIYQYVSEGVSRTNQLSTNFSARTARFTAYGNYALRFEKSDAESDGGFPSNQYDLGLDYGRALTDVRHSLTVGESVDLPFGVRSWGYLRATSGAPFNIVVGQDLNGDTQYNDRPSFATDLTRPSVVATRWGTFDTNPIPGQTMIPRNYGQGPGLLLVTLAVGKKIGVGPKHEAAPGAGAVRKYALEFWVESQNLLNHQNLTPPVGTLNSPLFGKSTGLTSGSSLSPDRVVDLQTSLRF